MQSWAVLALPATLWLAGNGFQVLVSWETPQGAKGQGRAFLLTTDTGAFRFFVAANVEVLVKVLDGCALNGAHWVFTSGLTDVKTTLAVVDTTTRATRTYVNAQGIPSCP
jgi:hypothetical protein